MKYKTTKRTGIYIYTCKEAVKLDNWYVNFDNVSPQTDYPVMIA